MLIERIRTQPILQLVWVIFLLLSLVLVFLKSSLQFDTSFSPFIPEELIPSNELWYRIANFSLSFLFYFLSLFQLSNLLRNHHFSGDSRFDMLFLLVPAFLLYPNLLVRLDLAIFLFFLVQSLKLQFEVHTQINIKKEIALIGLYMSLASLLFPKAILVAIFLYTGILIQRGFYLRELLIFLLCLSLPFYFICSILYLLDLPILFYFDTSFDLIVSFEFNLHNALKLAFGSIIFYIMIKSVFLNSKAILRSKAQFRNFYNLLFLGLIIYILFDKVEGVAIVFISVFAMFAHSLPTIKRTWILEALLSLVMLLSAAQLLLSS